jgi:hypothetical protein
MALSLCVHLKAFLVNAPETSTIFAPPTCTRAPNPAQWDKLSRESRSPSGLAALNVGKKKLWRVCRSFYSSLQGPTPCIRNDLHLHSTLECPTGWANLLPLGLKCLALPVPCARLRLPWDEIELCESRSSRHSPAPAPLALPTLIVRWKRHESAMNRVIAVA